MLAGSGAVMIAGRKKKSEDSLGHLIHRIEKEHNLTENVGSDDFAYPAPDEELEMRPAKKVQRPKSKRRYKSPPQKVPLQVTKSDPPHGHYQVKPRYRD